jgi:hypothetical protein
MKRIKYTLLLLLTTIAITTGLTGCTQNNGDIGPWFGRWRVEKITCDGLDLDIYSGPEGLQIASWAFQSNVVSLSAVYPHDVNCLAYGAWRQEGDRLLLDFTAFNDDSQSPGIYRPADVFHLEAGAVNVLTINSLTDSRMNLTHQSADGHLYQYYLKKLL